MTKTFLSLSLSLFISLVGRFEAAFSFLKKAAKEQQQIVMPEILTRSTTAFSRGLYCKILRPYLRLVIS
jgi:hypothetical protein